MPLIAIDTNQNAPNVTTETVQSSGFTVPKVLQEILDKEGPDVPRLVRVRRRVDRVMTQVVALALKDGGGGVVLNFEDDGALFGLHRRPGMTITAHGLTPQRLRRVLMVACDALAKAQEEISNEGLRA
ncbi:hypothetical protein HYPDE_41238 [Hyphomicrobium denitrificans 1NES1]|uniref:Uncharacterized protein n=1 Tax=Hyphomicrobium denitrificans 1NES1 TaxID=670307 RepID=N0BHK0_9HYPH|nr:hypothetical protein [Hyphomicrobium denitrificans]AGK59916.1 hypothetical protein HYPDE_41238 [Hyphomicrobium denitrificans 1NES1]